MTRETILHDGRRVAIRIEQADFNCARVHVSWRTKGGRRRIASRTGQNERIARLDVLTSGEVPAWVRREIENMIG